MNSSQTALKLATGATLVVAGVLSPLSAIASEPVTPAAPAQGAKTEAIESEIASTSVQSESIVNGVFLFSQNVLTPTDTISRTLYQASRVLCGGGIDSATVTAENVGDWTISVSGDVATSFTATVSDLTAQGAVRTTLGCSCAGNPVDGLASANAKVTGVTVKSILEQCGVAEGANTISFIADDGFAVRLPLSYVEQRYSMIVYEINGEAICDIAGSANQLWLGATSARYFAQNVSQIVISTENEADIPPTPGTPEAGDSYANLPNIAIEEGKVLV